MKTSIFHSIIFVSMFQGALLSPVETTDAISTLPPRELSVTSGEKLESREWIVDCNQLIDQVIKLTDQYPDYKSKVVAVSKTGTWGLFAFSVCKAFRVGAVDCTYGGMSVTVGLLAAFQHGFFDAQNVGAVPAEPAGPPVEQDPGRPSKNRRSLDAQINSLTTRMAEDLHDSGFNFESIENVPNLSGRDENGLMHRSVEIRGVHEPDQDEKFDYVINSRSDGTGDIKIIPNSTSSRLGRRTSDTPFFKVTYMVENRKGTLVPAGYKQHVNAIVADWEQRVDRDHGIIDYVGQFTSNMGTLSYRIAPHDKGYDERTYEDVAHCQGV
ncbi:uncharacterized protein GGS22DRAFT_197846 [Annulohypoxylon maeteangense]|uniref:uncharacterized protein n=1 Tax=Annulohypoxylon maeteangense TaxID=1927788 RepID=UPI0020089A75|nr:uncharacterized protein GGS22DRAFT_197846 [Annulohypoxylon maeteangense]KAI0887926.1 hypothetical protein GGS22DRAFT_197846 [Annulohypoxylon maeteangense]